QPNPIQSSIARPTSSDSAIHWTRQRPLVLPSAQSRISPAPLQTPDAQPTTIKPPQPETPGVQQRLESSPIASITPPRQAAVPVSNWRPAPLRIRLQVQQPAASD